MELIYRVLEVDEDALLLLYIPEDKYYLCVLLLSCSAIVYIVTDQEKLRSLRASLSKKIYKTLYIFIMKMKRACMHTCQKYWILCIGVLSG
jgi:hypothetical protein